MRTDKMRIISVHLCPIHQGEDMEEDQIVEVVQTKIYSIRNQKVMLDSDIAELYAVETKRVNEAVRNNPDKFPEDFYLELNVNEQDFLRSKFSTLKKGRGQHRKYPPKAFTEQGVYGHTDENKKDRRLSAFISVPF